MKITKSVLKQIIKEELSRMEEAEEQTTVTGKFKSLTEPPARLLHAIGSLATPRRSEETGVRGVKTIEGSDAVLVKFANENAKQNFINNILSSPQMKQYGIEEVPEFS